MYAFVAEATVLPDRVEVCGVGAVAVEGEEQREGILVGDWEGGDAGDCVGRVCAWDAGLRGILDKSLA